jgi:5-methylcytosine-specific restriction enzyme A
MTGSKVRTARPRVATVDTRAVKPPAKAVDSYYNTPEHRGWAKAVVQRSGRRCQDPQHGSRRPRDGMRLVADHIIERRDGGAALDVRNGMARCGACHTRKTLAERAKRMRET